MAIRYFLTALAIVCGSHSAWGALKIGEILKPAGAHATVNGKVIQASIPLFWGDRLFTGPDTTLDVIVYPAFSLKLKPSSEVRLIGNLIEKNGERLMASTAIEALKGKLQGHVFSGSAVKNDLKIFSRRTISSIRGTTFEVSADAGGDDSASADDVSVFEGTVDVEPIAKADSAKTAFPMAVPVSAGQEFNASTAKVTSLNEAAPTDLVAKADVDAQWKKDEAAVLSAHAKEAKKYREIMERDVKSVSDGYRKDAHGMFKSIKGSYDQFKKKK